jgi:hypothetical protein
MLACRILLGEAMIGKRQSRCKQDQEQRYGAEHPMNDGHHHDEQGCPQRIEQCRQHISRQEIANGIEIGENIG